MGRLTAGLAGKASGPLGQVGRLARCVPFILEVAGLAAGAVLGHGLRDLGAGSSCSSSSGSTGSVRASFDPSGRSLGGGPPSDRAGRRGGTGADLESPPAGPRPESGAAEPGSRPGEGRVIQEGRALWEERGREGDRGVLPVAVVIPARNEAERLPWLLSSLQLSRPAPAEVVVVDDGSEDATAAVAAAYGVRCLAAGPPPADFGGKQWAVVRGALATSAPILVFLDADVTLAPGALGTLVRELADHPGLVSVQPWHEPGAAVEELAAGVNLAALLASGAGGRTGRSGGTPVAFGPCLVTYRRDWERTGGHARSPGGVLDDVDLARAYRAAGLPVRVLLGGELVRFRMYPGGWPDLLSGFRKNVAGGLAAAPALAALGTIAFVAGGLQAAAGALTGWHATGGRRRWLRDCIAYGAYAVACHRLFRRVGRFGIWTAYAYPVPFGTLAILLGASLSDTRRGRHQWKGRVVASGRAKKSGGGAR